MKLVMSQSKEIKEFVQHAREVWRLVAVFLTDLHQKTGSSASESGAATLTPTLAAASMTSKKNVKLGQAVRLPQETATTTTSVSPSPTKTGPALLQDVVGADEDDYAHSSVEHMGFCHDDDDDNNNSRHHHVEQQHSTVKKSEIVEFLRCLNDICSSE